MAAVQIPLLGNSSHRISQMPLTACRFSLSELNRRLYREKYELTHPQAS